MQGILDHSPVGIGGALGFSDIADQHQNNAFTACHITGFKVTQFIVEVKLVVLGLNFTGGEGLGDTVHCRSGRVGENVVNGLIEKRRGIIQQVLGGASEIDKMPFRIKLEHDVGNGIEQRPVMGFAAPERLLGPAEAGNFNRNAANLRRAILTLDLKFVGHKTAFNAVFVGAPHFVDINAFGQRLPVPSQHTFDLPGWELPRSAKRRKLTEEILHHGVGPHKAALVILDKGHCRETLHKNGEGFLDLAQRGLDSFALVEFGLRLVV